MTIELLNMNCMDYMAGLPDKAFDLAIVDPPYWIDINSSGRLGHYGGKGKTWDSETPSEIYFQELRRVSSEQIIWGGNYFLDYLTSTRCFLLWDKQQPEGVSFASCEFAWTSFDASAKTFYHRPQGEQRIHPTQKPVKLYEWLLTNYAKPGQRILDTHLGSGSSAIAAHNLGFDFVGTELDKDYYEAALARFNKHIAQGSLFDAVPPSKPQSMELEL
jgi:site-specific DNA-methyltransferase (adenine-specific)